MQTNNNNCTCSRRLRAASDAQARTHGRTHNASQAEVHTNAHTHAHSRYPATRWPARGAHAPRDEWAPPPVEHTLLLLRPQSMAKSGSLRTHSPPANEGSIVSAGVVCLFGAAAERRATTAPNCVHWWLRFHWLAGWLAERACLLALTHRLMAADVDGDSGRAIIATPAD